MSNESVTINVIIDDKIFTRFSNFESFYRRKAYLTPLIFAAILSVSAVFFLIIGNVLIGGLLLFVGLGLPAYRVSRILRAIKIQIKILDLKNPKTVYSLHFTEAPDGIEVTNHGDGDDPLRYTWSSIYGAYRVRGCIYLYVLPEKAYLLPDGQTVEGTDALIKILTKMLPPEKLHGFRKLSG